MTDSLLGSFEEQVLLSVVRTGEDAYGMSVRREIEATTGRDVSIGAVYATLDRLEAKGLVASSRSFDTGTRRVFVVTGTGTQALLETRELRERLWAGVELTARGIHHGGSG